MAQSRLISAQYALAASGGFGSLIVVAGAFGVGFAVMTAVPVPPAAAVMIPPPAGPPPFPPGVGSVPGLSGVGVGAGAGVGGSPQEKGL